MVRMQALVYGALVYGGGKWGGEKQPRLRLLYVHVSSPPPPRALLSPTYSPLTLPGPLLVPALHHYVYPLPLSKWNVDKVIIMTNTFAGNVQASLTSCNKRKIADAWKSNSKFGTATTVADWSGETCAKVRVRDTDVMIIGTQ